MYASRLDLAASCARFASSFSASFLSRHRRLHLVGVIAFTARFVSVL